MSRNRKNAQEVAAVVETPFSDVYDSAEDNVANGQTNYDVRANFTDSFKNVRKARACIIRCNKTVTVRFNSTTAPAITLDIAEGRIEIDRSMGLEISEIYITNNSGGTAAVKILLFP